MHYRRGADELQLSISYSRSASYHSSAQQEADYKSRKQAGLEEQLQHYSTRNEHRPPFSYYRHTPEVTQVIPYMGSRTLVFIFRFTVCSLLVTDLVLRLRVLIVYFMKYIELLNSSPNNVYHNTRTITTPGLNRQPLDPHTHNTYIFLSILCQNLYSVSHFLCPTLSQNSITAEVCKKQRSERTGAAVSPPSSPAVSVPPLARVDIAKSTTPYTNTPCATSGRVSCKLSTRHVQCNQSTLLNYTLNSGDNCPKDTSDGQESDTGNNSSQTSSNSSETKSRRVQIKSRGALFNGSRNGSLNSGRDDDEDDDDKNNSKVPRLLHQCEATALKESEMTEHDNHQPDDTYSNHEVSAQGHLRKSVTAVANSTQINLNESVYPAFDMSLLNGISYSLGSMWKSAKNVSLFGRNLHQDKDGNTFERPTEDDPNISEISNLSGLSNISELSFVSIQNTTLLEENVPMNGHTTDTDTNKVDVGHHDEEDKENNKNVTTYTGKACPEITPIAPRLKGRIRTRSENSPLTRTGPYDVPPSHLLRKKQRANLKSLSSNPNQTPVLKRKRYLSESIGIPPSRSKGGIDCVRVRDPGLYNCSAGLGSYIHLEHNYLDKQDTGRIDRGKLMAEISKALSIHGDDISHRETDISVNMAWCEEEIEAVTQKHSNRTTLHPIDQRNCLLYLLSRLNIHQTRLLSNKPNFNGLKLTILPERTEKFPIKCHPDSDGQPITLLYLKGV